MHREDVKAVLRKGFRSLGAFERAKGLPRQSVSDVLRGRASAETEKAIADALKVPLHVLFPRRYDNPKADASSIITDNKPLERARHRLTETVG